MTTSVSQGVAILALGMGELGVKIRVVSGRRDTAAGLLCRPEVGGPVPGLLSGLVALSVAGLL